MEAIIKRDHILEYHGNKDYVSSSGLKLIYRKSPLHYFNQQETEASPAMVFGSAYHTYVLEQDRFHEEYFVLDINQRPDVNMTMAAKVNKEWKEALLAVNSGKTCLESSTMQQIEAMYEALTANPAIRKVLIEQPGEVELSHYAELNGVKVKVRPDKLKQKVIIDLKTTEDASPTGFARNCYEFGYHLSAAMYCDVLESIDQNQRRFMFVAQEKKWPYVAQLYVASEAMLAQGRYEYTIALDRYKEALETGVSKGYDLHAPAEMQGIIELDLPVWAYKA
jgi:glutaredoxin-related protein